MLLYQAAFGLCLTLPLQVGECFPWSQSDFTYTLQNHNSVLGLREFAAKDGAGVRLLDGLSAPYGSSGRTARAMEPTSVTGASSAPGPSSSLGASRGRRGGESRKEDDLGDEYIEVVLEGGSIPQLERRTEASPDPPRRPLHLLALPLECNFSGARLSLEEALAFGSRSGPADRPALGSRPGLDSSFHASDASGKAAESGRPSGRPSVRHLVLLDATKGCSTCPPDLSRHPVDFVALSYYKIFGCVTLNTCPYPTGLLPIS